MFYMALPRSGRVSECQSIDWSVLKRFESQIPGESNMFVELIKLYIEDTAEQMEVMNRAIADSDLVRLRRVAHSLKGSSGNLGIRRLAWLSAELEEMKEHDFESARSILTEFEEEFRTVTALLQPDDERRE